MLFSLYICSCAFLPQSPLLLLPQIPTVPPSLGESRTKPPLHRLPDPPPPTLTHFHPLFKLSLVVSLNTQITQSISYGYLSRSRRVQWLRPHTLQPGKACGHEFKSPIYHVLSRVALLFEPRSPVTHTHTHSMYTFKVVHFKTWIVGPPDQSLATSVWLKAVCLK